MYCLFSICQNTVYFVLLCFQVVVSRSIFHLAFSFRRNSWHTANIHAYKLISLYTIKSNRHNLKLSSTNFQKITSLRFWYSSCRETLLYIRIHSRIIAGTLETLTTSIFIKVGDRHDKRTKAHQFSLNSECGSYICSMALFV